jgi:hypothetical protein
MTKYQSTTAQQYAGKAFANFTRASSRWLACVFVCALLSGCAITGDPQYVTGEAYYMYVTCTKKDIAAGNQVDCEIDPPSPVMGTLPTNIAPATGT